MTLEIRRMLVLSTAHVSKATSERFNTDDVLHWPCCGGIYNEYGWVFYCSEENGPILGPFGQELTAEQAALNHPDDLDLSKHIPDDLFAVMQFARSHGCDNVLLDRDADEVDGLPTYEW